MLFGMGELSRRVNDGFDDAALVGLRIVQT